MKKMDNGINIDKWRKLNSELFNSYIRAYSLLSQESSLNPATVMVDSLTHFNILGKVTTDAYGSVYTIAREVGIFYEEKGRFFLGNITESYSNETILFSDYMKYYVLNTEFLIYNKVVHPFEEIVNSLLNQSKNLNEIAQDCPKLIDDVASSSIKSCLQYFLDRCCLSELIVNNGGSYSLSNKYNKYLILGSINKTNLRETEFEEKFISSKDARSNKTIVEMINQKIPKILRSIEKLDNKNIPAETITKSLVHTSLFTEDSFNIDTFISSLRTVHLTLPDTLAYRFVSALQTKPFVILTGLSGSGKTKLAEAFSLWISENSDQYQMVSVGADWANREPLLGFPNALEPGKYVKPDSGVLDLILRASKDETKPYFLLLDEMNMSHVERYFADFLSAMESIEGEITLHPDGEEWIDCDVPEKLRLPKNLFIIGTVNIDETTYMFSPKVLDRANVIEFRVSYHEMEEYLNNSKVLDMELLKTQGASMGSSFLEGANSSVSANSDLAIELLPFFEELQKIGSEFGYRTASEIGRFVAICTAMAKDKMDDDQVIDAAVMQKLLPKLHGSRNKIEKILVTLGKLCINDSSEEPFSESTTNIKYPLSHEKLKRMHMRVLSDGFTSFAEA